MSGLLPLSLPAAARAAFHAASSEAASLKAASAHTVHSSRYICRLLSALLGIRGYIDLISFFQITGDNLHIVRADKPRFHLNLLKACRNRTLGFLCTCLLYTSPSPRDS